jgi:hypothetical protein
MLKCDERHRSVPRLIPRVLNEALRTATGNPDIDKPESPVEEAVQGVRSLRRRLAVA